MVYACGYVYGYGYGGSNCTDILLFGLSQGKPEQASCLRRITSANTPTHGISHRVLGAWAYAQ